MCDAKNAPPSQVEPAPVSTSPVRLIAKTEVLRRIGVTYPTLWLWMRQGKFPRSRELGGKVAWVEAEIDSWILSRPVRRLKGDKSSAIENHTGGSATQSICGGVNHE